MKKENIWIRLMTFILVCVMVVQFSPVYAVEEETVEIGTELTKPVDAPTEPTEDSELESTEEFTQEEIDEVTQAEEEIEDPTIFEDENGSQWIGLEIPAESVTGELPEEPVDEDIQVYDVTPILSGNSSSNKRGVVQGATYKLYVMGGSYSVYFDQAVTLSYYKFAGGNDLTGEATPFTARYALHPKYIAETYTSNGVKITNYYVAYCMSPDVSAFDGAAYENDTNDRWNKLYAVQKAGISLAVAYGFRGKDAGNWYVAPSNSSNENARISAAKYPTVSSYPGAIALYGSDAETYYKSVEQFLATQLVIWEIVCGYRDCREGIADRYAFSTHNGESQYGKGTSHYFPNYPTVYTAYNMIDRLLYLHTKKPSYASNSKIAPPTYEVSRTIGTDGVPAWRFTLTDDLAISDAFEVGVPNGSPLAPYLKNGGIKWSVGGSNNNVLWITVYDFSAAALLMSGGSDCVFTVNNKYMKKVAGGSEAVIALQSSPGGGAQPICSIPNEKISPDPTAYYFKLKTLASSASIIRKVSNSGGNVSGITFKFRNETKNANVEFTTDSYGNATGDITPITSFNQVAMYHFVEKVTSGIEPIESVELIIKNGSTEKQHIIINREFYKYSSNGGAFTTVAVDHTVTTNGNIKYYFGSGDNSPVFGVQNDGSTQGFWNVTLNISDDDTIEVIATNGTTGNLDIIKTVNGSASTSANGWTFNIFKTKPSPTYWYREVNATGTTSYPISSFTNGLATGSPVIGVYVGDVAWPKSGENYYTFTRNSSSRGTLFFYGAVVPQQGDVITIVYKTYDGRNNSPDYTETTQAIGGVNGKISIPNLAPGTYYVEEVPQFGYKWIGSMRTVSVSTGDTASVTFDNIPLNGFEFQIQKTITSGKSGQVSGWQFYRQTGSANVRYYSKSITSTGASSYTVTPSTSYPFGVNPIVEVYVNDSLWPTSGNSYYTFTRNSTTKGTLKFVGDIVPLNGDTITVVYRTNRTGGTDLGTTDTNGLLNPSNIATGTYYVEEVPQIGYKYCDPKSVTINTGSVIALPFENTPLSTRLLIKKTIAEGSTGNVSGWQFVVYNESVRNTLVSQGGTAYGIATYTATENGVDIIDFGDLNIQDSSASVIEVYKNGTLLELGSGYTELSGVIVLGQALNAGDVVNVVYRNPAASSLRVYTTDANGYISISNLTAGTYYVEELPVVGYAVTGANPKSVTVSNYSTSNVVFENKNDVSIEIQKEFAEGITGSLSGWRFVTYSTALDHPLVYMNTFPCNEEGRWQDVGNENQEYFDYPVYDILAVYINGVPGAFTSHGDGELTLTDEFSEGDEITVVYTTAPIGYKVLGPTDSTGKIIQTISPGTYYVEEIPQYGYEIPVKQTASISSTDVSLTFTNTKAATLNIQKKLADGVTGNIAGLKFAIYPETSYSDAANGEKAFNMYSHILTAEECDNQIVHIDEFNNDIANNTGIVDLYCNGVHMARGDDYQVSEDDTTVYIFDMSENDLLQIVYKRARAGDFPIYTTDNQGQINMPDMIPGVYYVEELPNPAYAPQPSQKVTLVNGQTSYVEFTNTIPTLEIQKGFTEGSTGSLAGWEFILYSAELTQPLVYMNSFPCNAEGHWRDVSYENQGYFDYDVYEILTVYINGEEVDFDSQGAELYLMAGDFTEGDEVTVVYTTANRSYQVLGATDASGKITASIKPGSYYIEEIPQYGYEIPEKQQVILTDNTTLSFPNTQTTGLWLKKELANGITGTVEGIQFSIYTEENYSHAMADTTAYGMISHIATAEDCQDMFFLIDDIDAEAAQNEGIVALYCNGRLMAEGTDYRVNQRGDRIDAQDFFVEGDLIQIVYKKYHSGDTPIYTTDENGWIMIPDLAPGNYYIEELPNPAYAPQPSRRITLVSGQTAYVEFVNTIPTIEIQKEFASGTSGSLEGWEFIMYSGNLNRPLVYMNSFPCDEGGCWDDVEGEHQDFFDYLVYDILQVYVNGEPTSFYTYGDRGLELTGEFAVDDEITIVYTTAPIDYKVLGPTDEAGVITQSVNPGLYHVEEVPQYGYEIPEKQTVIITEDTSLVFANRSPTGLTIQKILANGVTGNVSGIEFFICNRDYYDDVISTNSAFGMISHIVTADEVEYEYFDLFDIGIADDEYVTVYSIYRNNELVDRGDYGVDCEFVEFSGLFEEGDLVQFVYKKSPVDNSHVYTTEEDGRILIEGLTAGEYYIEELPIPQYVMQAPMWTMIKQGENVEVGFMNSKPFLEIVKSFAPGTIGLSRGWGFVLYTEKTDQPLVYMNTFPCNEEGYWQSVGYENQEYFDYDVYDILAVYINGELVDFDSQADELYLMDGDFVEGDAITVVYTTMDIDYTVTATTNARGRITVRNLSNGIYYVEEIPKFGYKIPSKQRVVVSGQESNTLNFVNATEEYLGSIQIEKVDIQDNPLEGAHFVLQYREVGEDVWETAVYTDDNSAMEAGYFYTDQEVNEDNSITTDVDGIARFSQLKANGTIEYQLVEVQAPAGCDLMQSPVYVGVLPAQITFDDKDGLVAWREAYQHDSGDYIVESTTVRQYNVYYCVVNNAVILPTPTGGSGLMMVTFGSMGMAISAFAIVTTRKKRKGKSDM